MGVLSLKSSVSALQAQRQLNINSGKLQSAYEKLSSGLRIQDAGDGAAELAVAAKLNVNTRVLARAVLNANDGISALNIADGALSSLNDILQRVEELAQSSANGILTLTQRRALDTEGKALTDEYNRIVNSTKFNRLAALDGTLSNLSIQLGSGANTTLSVGISNDFDRSVGNGTYATGSNIAHSEGGFTTGDVDNDGDLDIVNTLGSNTGIEIALNNGNGTFSVLAVSTGGAEPNNPTLADVNGDNNLDIIWASGGSGIAVQLGNGNGTFGAQAYSYGSSPSPAHGKSAAADLDGDGNADLVIQDYAHNTLRVYRGNGNGTFAATVSIAQVGSVAQGSTPYLSDVNNDGKLDIVSASGSGVNISLGNGNGTFASVISFAAGSTVQDIAVGDVNFDGYLDIASASDTTVSVFLGNGNGTFQNRASFSLGSSSYSVDIADVNGDGLPDLVGARTAASGAIGIYIGNGNGTFASAVSSSAIGSIYDLQVADVTGDGAADIIAYDFSNTYVAKANTTQSYFLPRVNLLTRADALEALTTIGQAKARVQLEQSSLGANMRRLTSGLNTISVTRENYSSALSRIVDADVAEESAKLVALQIQQQGIVAVLAQANQQSEIVLGLIRN